MFSTKTSIFEIGFFAYNKNFDRYGVVNIFDFQFHTIISLAIPYYHVDVSQNKTDNRRKESKS